MTNELVMSRHRAQQHEDRNAPRHGKKEPKRVASGSSRTHLVVKAKENQQKLKAGTDAWPLWNLATKTDGKSIASFFVLN